MRSDAAARDIRKKKVEHISDQAQRAKIGQIEDASQTAEYHDVLQQEADLTAGHGILRYTGLIAVSAPTVEELDAAVAAIEQAAIQASCETRPLVGQQAAAFTAAALPLCRRVHRTRRWATIVCIDLGRMSGEVRETEGVSEINFLPGTGPMSTHGSRRTTP